MKYIALLTFIFLLVVSCTPRTDSSFPATPAVTLSISPTQAFTPTVPPPSPTPSATPSPTLTPTSTATPEPKAVISRDNVAQLKTVLTVENRYGSPHAMFSPDGRLLVAKTSPFGEGNKSVSKVFFWNLETLQEASPLETADRIFFTHLAFDVDGQSILVGTWPNTSQAISLLRLSDGQHLLDIPVPRESLGRIVRRIALSPDGQWIAIGFTDGQLEIYARKDGQRVFQEKIKSARNVSIIEALAFSPDSRFLAAGGAEKTIYLWSTSDWKMLMTFAPGKGTIFDLAFSPDGSFLAAAEGGSDGRVSLWNVQTSDAKAPVASFPFPSLSVEFSPDGSLVVAGGANGHLSFWRTDTYEQVARLPAHKTRIEALDFSPDGQFLASGSATTSRPYELKLWRVPAP
jgi:hypothetical protein